MKNIGLLVCLPIIFTGSILNAQSLKIEKKNYVSFDPLLPWAGTYQFQYERVLKNRFSINLSVGYKFSSGNIDISSIDFNRFLTEEFDFTGLKLIPEFRWYFQGSHTGLTGFYAGIYFRYQNRRGDIAGTYTAVDNQISPILIDANLSTFNPGLEVGYKLNLGKGFFTDFIIAGPGISFNTLELNEVNPVPQAFYDDLTDALKRLGIIDLIDSDFEINGNQKTEAKLIAFRYGIKIGYSF
ncbi:hypothetical protein [uncultured Croceitalea sp.]|uniref:hypothetical protein n=1 Tax=uncultured Croceitalea sp. TaxID=1798908 RepID=UPI003305D5B4